MAYYISSTHFVLSLFGVRISIRKIPRFVDYIYFKFIADWYTIIPIGTYCLPRVISTLTHLKPTKKLGEPTFPFDLAFFNDMDVIADLIRNRFSNFYNGLEYVPEHETVPGPDRGCYINRRLKAIFNHDGMLTKEQFVRRYNSRIKNFYNCLSNKNSKKIFFIAAVSANIDQCTVDNILNAIKIYRNTENFSIIIINQNKENKLISKDNIYIIDMHQLEHEFSIINTDGQWLGELSSLKSDASRKIYLYLKKALQHIIHKP